MYTEYNLQINKNKCFYNIRRVSEKLNVGIANILYNTFSASDSEIINRHFAHFLVPIHEWISLCGLCYKIM